MPTALTGRQDAILRFIATYTAVSGYPPSMREIGAGVGLSSPGTVRYQLRELERMGYLLARPDGMPRAVSLTPGGGAVARMSVAEEIARAIEASVCEPGEHCVDRFCPDCIRYRQSVEDAATARRVGGSG